MSGKIDPKAIERLWKTSPDAFNLFVKAFATYTDELTVAVTEASPDRILVLQGQAQNARSVLVQLTDVYRQKPSP